MEVLLTGANGVVGTAITDALADDDRFHFTGLDLEPGDGTVDHVTADVRDPDALREHLHGKDAVIHLALIPGTGGHTDRSVAWNEAQAENLASLHHVAEAIVETGVETFIFASSNHAVGLPEVINAPEIYSNGPEFRIDHTEPHRPDSLYGLTKTYGEDLSRLLAEVHDVRCYALRIGAVRAPQYDHPYGDAERGVDTGAWERDSPEYREQVARMKGLWQSRRDLAQLVACCLEDDTVEWDQFYGVSGNDRRWLDDLDHAEATIGYEPVDNGETWDGPPPEGAP